MNKCLVLSAVIVIALQGCGSTQRCEKPRPYQETVAIEPLSVPDDLSEPRVRSRAPDVEANAPTMRPDGACLEEPPPFERDTDDESEAGN
ncbi:MAG: hypothetical protein OER80_04950 [Gammaproteobacteria bacterium]|nr:hypothetical protein [Gammaproteobacteria bacterium]